MVVVIHRNDQHEKKLLAAVHELMSALANGRGKAHSSSRTCIESKCYCTKI
jgi:hypothetical protein